jgi:hypothetical protein
LEGRVEPTPRATHDCVAARIGHILLVALLVHLRLQYVLSVCVSELMPMSSLAIVTA